MPELCLYRGRATIARQDGILSAGARGVKVRLLTGRSVWYDVRFDSPASFARQDIPELEPVERAVMPAIGWNIPVSRT